MNSVSQTDPSLSELYSPFISLTFPRLTGRMNVSHGDDKNPLAVQKKKKEEEKFQLGCRQPSGGPHC